MFRSTGISKYRPGMLASCGAILLAALITACGGGQKEPPEEGAIRIHLQADKDINPNERGNPAPLNLFIYLVKEEDVFRHADFLSIIDTSNRPLQAAAAKVYDAILQPGESRSLVINPGRDVKTLGIVAAWRNINDAQWLVTWPIPEKKKSWWPQIFSDELPELRAHFKNTAITIKKMD